MTKKIVKQNEINRGSCPTSEVPAKLLLTAERIASLTSEELHSDIPFFQKTIGACRVLHSLLRKLLYLYTIPT